MRGLTSQGLAWNGSAAEVRRNGPVWERHVAEWQPSWGTPRRGTSRPETVRLEWQPRLVAGRWSCRG